MIGKLDVFSHPLVSNAPLVALEQGYAFIPFAKALRIEQELEELALLEGDESQESAVVQLCSRIAPKGHVVYVEAEFFGGVGAQASIRLSDGVPISAKEISPQAINEALKWIGVSKGGCVDEFESLGLGRSRGTDLWASLPA